MIAMRLVVLWACHSLVASCVTASAHPPRPQSPQRCDVPSPQDSSIVLREVAPLDSIWLTRNGTTIIFSMQDAEEYFSDGPLSHDNRAFRDELRRAFDRDGTVRLGESGLADLLAAHLLRRGKAVVRDGRGEPFRCIWTRLKSVEVDGRVITHREFYDPLNMRFLRVLESVTVS